MCSVDKAWIWFVFWLYFVLVCAGGGMGGVAYMISWCGRRVDRG